MSEAEFYKFLRRDQQVEDRLRRGELKPDLMGNLYHLFGGTPRFLEQVRTLLRTADPDSLTDDSLGEDLPLEEARRQYCERILLPQLYAALSAVARQLTSRLAVSELPLPPAALAGLLDNNEEAAVWAVEEAVVYGLVQAFREDGLPTLYQPPGLVRPWLLAEERLGVDERRMADAFVAHFWRLCFEGDRAITLRVPIDVQLLTCRNHAARAEEHELFLWATRMLVSRLVLRSAWRQARSLLDEVPEGNRDGGCWHDLASIDMNEGGYTAAREKFGKALLMRQQISNRAGEAATWHQMATLDLIEGDYTAAREKFSNSLAINQQVGDCDSEPATWHNLATIDLNEGDCAAAREKSDKALLMSQQISDRAGEAAAWHQLATIDMNEGDYTAAREKFGKALLMRQQISNRAGEAATWHQMATLDLTEGDYTAAREKFSNSLAINQQVGDRAGEAAAFYQLGFLAWKTGQQVAAIPLAVIGFGILHPIGHADAQTVLKNLSIMCSVVGYDQDQVMRLLQSVAESYARDRGRQLLLDAFPDWKDFIPG